MKICTRLLPVWLLLAAAGSAQAQCSVSAGNDQTVYIGYAPLSCALLTATPGGTAPFSYSWSNGDSSASIQVCDTLAATYWVTVTDSNGCTATDTVNVSVMDVRCGHDNRKVLVCHIPPGNPAKAHAICVSPHAVPAHLAHGCSLGSCAPAVCSVHLGNDTAFCSGGSLSLNAGRDFTSYLWSDSSTARTLTVTQSGTYWVVATDSRRNCTATDTIEVTVWDAPSVTVTADSLPDSLGCRNVTALATGGTPPLMYQWNTGDSLSSIYVCDTMTATYTVMVSDSNGCSASASVTVMQPLTCSVQLGNDTMMCISTPVVLDAGSGFTSYLWSDSTTAQTLSVSQSGTYWVQVHDSVSGCTASDTIVLTLYPAPSAMAVADSIPDSLGCVHLTGSYAGGTAPYTWIWSNSDTSLVTVVCDSTTMTYLFTVTDSNGCAASAAVTVNDTVQRPVQICHVPPGNPSRAEAMWVMPGDLQGHLAHGDYLGMCSMRVVQRGEVTVRPNPVLDRAGILFVSPESGTVSVALYDMTGTRIATLFSGTVRKDYPNEIRFSGDRLHEGIYFIRMTNPDGTTVNTKISFFKY